MNVVLSRTLDGSVAAVTGASGGLGRAICAAMSDAGATIVATDLSDRPEDMPADLWLHHDVTSATDWSRVVSEIRHRYGRLDCLVNNAGIALVERVANTSLDQWRRVSSVNVESVLLGVQASLELLRESGKGRLGGASVVNVSSVAGVRGVAFNSAYSASKAAVSLFSKSAAKEFAMLEYPIRVNSVHPGTVETPMLKSILSRYVEAGFASSIDQQAAIWNDMSPLRRMARPEEIAGGVVFLCSPAASFITGSEFIIDGAVTA